MSDEKQEQAESTTESSETGTGETDSLNHCPGCPHVLQTACPGVPLFGHHCPDCGGAPLCPGV